METTNVSISIPPYLKGTDRYAWFALRCMRSPWKIIGTSVPWMASKSWSLIMPVWRGGVMEGHTKVLYASHFWCGVGGDISRLEFFTIFTVMVMASELDLMRLK